MKNAPQSERAYGIVIVWKRGNHAWADGTTDILRGYSEAEAKEICGYYKLLRGVRDASVREMRDAPPS